MITKASRDRELYNCYIKVIKKRLDKDIFSVVYRRVDY